MELKWNPNTGEMEASREVGGGPGKRSGGVKRGADGKIKGTGDVPSDLFGD